MWLRWFVCAVALLSACGEPSAVEDELLRQYLTEHPDVVHAHHAWHTEHLRTLPDYGAQFLAFHHRFVGAYEAWRAEAGAPPLTPWDPGTPIPAAQAHAGRATSDPSAVDPLCRIPTWLTVEGGTARAPQYVATRLTEFTSSEQLGSVIDGVASPTWHMRVHKTIGGDMADLHTATRDPVFWSFHKLIDDIWTEWERATAPVDESPEQP
jgi:hypothetical protein